MKLIKIYLAVVVILLLSLASILSYAANTVPEIELTRSNHAELITGVNGEVVDNVIKALIQERLRKNKENEDFLQNLISHQEKITKAGQIINKIATNRIKELASYTNTILS